MAQTSYSTAQADGFAGMISDLAVADIRSALNEEATEILFGIAVKQGTNKEDIKLPTAATDKIEGFTIHSHAIDNRSDTEDIPADTMVGIMRSGYFYAMPEVNVTKGDPVFARIATSGAKTQKGALGNVNDSGTCIHVKGARWAETGTASTPTPVEVKLSPEQVDTVDFRLDHAQATADTTSFLTHTRATQHLVIDTVDYHNPTGLVADATNFFDISLLSGTTTHANWSTETGEEGTIAAATTVQMTNGSDLVVPPDTDLSLVLDEDGTATLPAGSVVVHGHYI